MKTTRFARCATCNEIYPHPHHGPCPNCEDEAPVWQAWDPRTEHAPEIRQIPDILVGLLMLLEEHGHEPFQDHDGRLYYAVRDALVVVSQDMSAPRFRPYEDFYLQPAKETR
jgi:hypothetical protein